jgi:hypothetical protein
MLRTEIAADRAERASAVIEGDERNGLRARVRGVSQ